MSPQHPRTPIARACALVLLALASGAAGDGDRVVFTDPADDTALRATHRSGEGSISLEATIPDVLRLTILGWAPTSPAIDPFAGQPIDGEGADIFRIDLELAGLVNPPGTLGFAGQPFDPFRFGQSPLLGFIELDVDDRKDTGGHLDAAAEQRFMANAARFGGRRESSIGERNARSADDYDRDIFTPPQFERSGTDFGLDLCGCQATTLVREVGDGDGRMQAGETMLVRSRYFVRSEGYIRPSGVSGGSVPGAYDPWVEVRFHHDAGSDVTTVSLVGALTQRGAGLLAGRAPEPIDFRVDNQWSVEEAVNDLIDAAPRAAGQARVLIEDWEGRDPEDSLDPTDWDATAVVGTPYVNQATDGLYVWTDVGFDLTRGDFDGDAIPGELDKDALRLWVIDNDGGPLDGGPGGDGRVALERTPYNFSIFDLDASNVVEHPDLAAYGHRADLDGDGLLTVFDFLAFQNAFDAGDPVADFTLDGRFDIFDFLAFQNAFDAG